MSEKLTQAMQLISRGDDVQAERLLSELIQANSDLAQSFYGIGLIRMRAKKLDVARSCFQKCLDLEPGHANSFYYLGEIAESKGDRKSADYFFQRAIEANPAHSAALKKLGGISREPNGSTQTGEALLTGSQTSRSDTIENDQPEEPPSDSGSRDDRNDLYSLLRRSSQPVEKEISRQLDKIAAVIGTARRQRFRASISVPKLLILAFLSTNALGFVIVAANTNDREMRRAEPLINIAFVLFMILLWILLPFGAFLRAKTSKLSCDRDFLISTTGVFNKSVENVHLFWLAKSGPVSTRQSLMNRFTNDGTLDVGGTDLSGYFRKTELDELSSLFRQASLLNPTSRDILAALGELKQIRSGAQ